MVEAAKFVIKLATKEPLKSAIAVNPYDDSWTDSFIENYITNFTTSEFHPGLHPVKCAKALMTNYFYSWYRCPSSSLQGRCC